MIRPEEFESMIPSLVIVFMWRALYEFSRHRPEPNSLEHRSFIDAKQPECALTHRQREWADKAVKRYAEAQEKKWRKWNEAMFELD